ncbi:transglutaminase family protein [Stratiformator vulcanicus]|uniref:Protein-glutamine gamma-glutamyltransferase n=1 Tax=Stratiformator vulcanicus TaxID=2527980 RepID=A0A517QX89_9PLAN|nr:transglutaminase family protein [Stratiformator vulcanicus]QDT36203.1 Protein-glutamine gamma-glutamyltransferase [Stratiformator vulcanicus]
MTPDPQANSTGSTAVPAEAGPVRYRITHTTSFNYSAPSPVCHNRARLSPRERAGQSTDFFRLVISPEPSDAWVNQDYFGNRVDYFSIQDAHSGLTVTAVSDVTVQPPIAKSVPNTSLPWESVRDELAGPKLKSDDLPLLRFRSPLVPMSDQATAYAQESFLPDRPIVEAGLDLTRRIHTDFKYDTRATTVSTPVDEVFEKRAGVCQDFAHVQLACLRSLGLASRYVSGYLRTLPPPGKPRLVGVDASHAWVGLYCGEEVGWVDFDPTNDVIPKTDHVTLALGRDYADTCPVAGVFIGGGDHTMSVSVDVAPMDET